MYVITMSPRPGPTGPRGRYYTYSSPGVQPYSGGPNGLREFCRKMTAEGLRDAPATVVGADGVPRLFIRSIEGAGTKDLRETEKGFRIVPHDPSPNPFSAVPRQSARAS